FEPGTRECIGELLRMIVKAARYFFIDRIEAQRQIRSQHGRYMLFGSIVGVRNAGSGIPGPPLLDAGRTFGQLPLVLEKVVEEIVAPFRRRLSPGDFRAACNGI